MSAAHGRACIGLFAGRGTAATVFVVLTAAMVVRRAMALTIRVSDGQTSPA